MKKGILLKATSAIVATALVATSVLIYVDKKSANASKKVTSACNTVDKQVNTAMDSIEEVSVKGNTTTYTMNVKNKKVTYKVTDTATGRKVIQTDNKTSEYTQLEISDNRIFSVTTGEIKDGKYVKKSSKKYDIQEEAKKQKAENDNISTRAYCKVLGNFYWYEKNESSINIGRTKSINDIEKKTIELSSLNKNNAKNVEEYQNLIDKSAKNYSDAQSNLNNISSEAICMFIGSILSVLLVGFVLGPEFIIDEIIRIVATVLLYALPLTIGVTKFTVNYVKGLNNALKAKKAYNKIVVLGKDY